ncbi:MAG: hypothetical protein ACEQSR_13780 [Candidatus Methylacidiphilales bacterium]
MINRHICNVIILLNFKDFRKSYNYGIDLEVNKVKNARFASTGLSGLLLKYPIIID